MAAYRPKGIEYPGITVCSFCHDGNGNVYLNKRSVNCRDEHGRWDICGGSVDLGDTIEETLRKEVAEEYCTDVLNIEFLGFRDMLRMNQDGHQTHWVGLDFKVHIDREKAKNGEPHKFEEVGWFPIDAMPEPLHSQLPLFMERYKDKLAS